MTQTDSLFWSCVALVVALTLLYVAGREQSRLQGEDMERAVDYAVARTMLVRDSLYLAEIAVWQARAEACVYWGGEPFNLDQAQQRAAQSRKDLP